MGKNVIVDTVAETRANPLAALFTVTAVNDKGRTYTEVSGQNQIVLSDVLPACHGRDEDWTALGFVFEGPVPSDELFVNVKFPAGWTKKRTDHSMYTDILDENGRKRGTIMYKADPWDRDAAAHLSYRFRIGSDYNSETSTFSYVEASEGIVFRTETVLFTPDMKNWDTREIVEEQALVWLNQNYPDHKNRGAYWDIGLTPIEPAICTTG